MVLMRIIRRETCISVPNNMTETRRFLFLQGPLSSLYKKLGEKLQSEGHEVYRINFNLGDWIHWHGRHCFNFRTSVSDWPAFFEKFIISHGITDLVLHSDRRIYHKAAIKIAKKHQLYIAVTELGILRPGWLTIEINGLGLLSHFPNDPDYLLEQAQKLPAPIESWKFSYPFSQMAFWDVSYNLLNYFFSWLYPHYQRHTPYNPVLEYSRAAFRLIAQKKSAKVADRVLTGLIEIKAKYYVLPLQLNGDFQVRDYSPYHSMKEVIEQVFTSFAQHASADSRLLVKQHPLDPGLDKLKQVTLTLAKDIGIAERVHYIDGGDLNKAFRFCRGSVMVNSSAALEALQQGIAVKTLAPAIYDMPELTYQGPLDDFWESEFLPDANLYAAFETVLKHTTQVPGALYGDKALKTAVMHMSRKILDKQLNRPGGYINPPPRLAANKDWFEDSIKTE